jgi:hypothetical protein
MSNFRQTCLPGNTLDSCTALVGRWGGQRALSKVAQHHDHPGRTRAGCGSVKWVCYFQLNSAKLQKLSTRHGTTALSTHRNVATGMPQVCQALLGKCSLPMANLHTVAHTVVEPPEILAEKAAICNTITDNWLHPHILGRSLKDQATTDMPQCVAPTPNSQLCAPTHMQLGCHMANTTGQYYGCQTQML